MEPAVSGLSLVTWQGWGVLSVIAVLTALLGTILAWLLPFPQRSLTHQLANYDDRMALKDRLGAAPPVQTYLSTLKRFHIWLHEWFGAAFSGQAFERCLAIAFIFPITLFLITLLADGANHSKVNALQVILFAFALAVITFVIVVAFRNLLKLIERTWKRFGGDSDLALTISRVVLGAFAVMIAFTIAFSIATTFSGGFSSASVMLGAAAGGFALAFAFAIAFALAGAALFSIVVAILGGAALSFASQFAFLLFLFFILLPVVNATIDWLSWGVTRFLLSHVESVEGNSTAGIVLIIGAVVATFISGTVFMIVLAALLPNAIEAVNHFFAIANIPPFDWRALLQKAVEAPWTDGLFVTGMLMTTIVPASSHLIVSLAALLSRYTPGARTAAYTISDHPEVQLSEGEVSSVRMTLMFSWSWYLVAAVLTVGLIVGASALVYFTHTPVAQFLSTIALCSTVWSHGQCPWL